MKTILLLIHDDDGQEGRLQVALDLCRAAGGHLSCLDVTYAPPIVGGFYDDAYAVGELLVEETARERDNKRMLTARLAGEDVPWDWIDMTGDFAPCLQRAAALADVIVVNRHVGGLCYPDMRGATAELVVRSGKPVIAVPPACRRLDRDTALVAWDGSHAATAALRAAVPLLQRTGRVTIVEGQDGSVVIPAEDAATYLSRYDVHAEVRRLATPQGAGAALLAEAASDAFGYLVMGGFGHARLTEMLFGGVTRALLADCPIPLFLAH